MLIGLGGLMLAIYLAGTGPIPAKARRALPATPCLSGLADRDNEFSLVTSSIGWEITIKGPDCPSGCVYRSGRLDELIDKVMFELGIEVSRSTP